MIGLLNADGKRVFFTGNPLGFVLEVHNLKSLEGLLEFLQQVTGIVLAVMVHHNQLVARGVLLEQHARQVFGQVAGLIAGTDDNRHGMGLRLLTLFRAIEGEATEYAPIIKELNKSEDTEKHKADQSPIWVELL
jgi:hypothetical protein